MTDERALNPAPDDALPPADDELRFAPPLDAPDEAAIEEALDAPDEAAIEEALAVIAAPEPFDSPLDVDAALAAVSRLDDILAEEEAAEQARLAREQAEAEAAEQRAARLRHPEYFFAMPPLLITQRGRVDSVVPALALIAVGAWLTFTLTTSAAPPDSLLALAAAAALSATLLARWLAAGRWARGLLLLALLILAGAAALYLVAAGPGLVAGWPLLLLAPAAAFAGVGLLARPRQPRLLLVAALLAAAALAGLAVAANVIPPATQAQIAPLWPIAAAALLVALALPLLRRR